MSGGQLLELPAGVDWKGDHESYLKFLDAIYNNCSVSYAMQCGKKENKNCDSGLCELLKDQAALDRLLWLYETRTTGHDYANREVPKEGNWS